MMRTGRSWGWLSLHWYVTDLHIKTVGDEQTRDCTIAIKNLISRTTRSPKTS